MNINETSRIDVVVEGDNRQGSFQFSIKMCLL